jgi:tyrosinase co-factor MelC1
MSAATTSRRKDPGMVTRRRMITAAAAVSGTAAALRPAHAAARTAPDASPAPGPGADEDAAGHAAGTPGDQRPLFDEMYRDRRIQAFGTAGGSAVAILIDGRPLHVMRRVDGSWISMADHYQPYPTPLATARGAVDVIGLAQLAADAGHPQRHRAGNRDDREVPDLCTRARTSGI